MSTFKAVKNRLLDAIESPKNRGNAKTGRSSWYPYYAGFSNAFVESVVKSISRHEDDVILDPWNGVGTTTDVAAGKSRVSVGSDLNPAMVIVARSKLITSTDALSAVKAAPRLIKRSKSTALPVDVESDPLSSWFSSRSAKSIRGLETLIRSQVALEGQAERADDLYVSAKIPPRVCLYYLALFRVIRSLLTDFVGTNKAWTKKPRHPNLKVDVPLDYVEELFIEDLARLYASAVDDNAFLPEHASSRVRIELADSRKLPMLNESVDLVLTSPPYCTRIDYAVATAFELSVLGITAAQLNVLRRRMIGSTAIQKISDRHDRSFGETCEKLLREIRRHPSKASDGYYLKTLKQYFSGLFDSLSEISRVLRTGACALIVVQDSNYKEIHINLAKIVYEMALALNLKQIEERKFVGFPSMASVNPSSRSYARAAPVESVLLLKKF